MSPGTSRARRRRPRFTVDDVRIVSRDDTSLAVNVFTPNDDDEDDDEDDGRDDRASVSGRVNHAFRGHAIVMVHAHPKFGGSPEMMHGKGEDG